MTWICSVVAAGNPVGQASADLVNGIWHGRSKTSLQKPGGSSSFAPSALLSRGTNHRRNGAKVKAAYGILIPRLDGVDGFRHKKRLSSPFRRFPHSPIPFL